VDGVETLSKTSDSGRSPLSPGSFLQATVFGATLHAMTLEDMHGLIGQATETGSKCLIAHHNLHSLYLLHRESHQGTTSEFHRFYERAHFTNIDGMSLVLLARLLGYRVNRSHRFTYSFTIRLTLEQAQLHGWRVFYVGSSAEVVEKARAIIRKDFPALEFRVHDGFFNKQKMGKENQEMLARIADFRPNILFVGMGMPRQEFWVVENFDSIQADTIITSGATLEYIAGSLRTPPEWVSRIGMQWVYRLLTEPARLGFRYLGEPVMLLWYLFRSGAGRGSTEDRSSRA